MMGIAISRTRIELIHEGRNAAEVWSSKRSPDGAKRNPGLMDKQIPHSASLHAGYETA